MHKITPASILDEDFEIDADGRPLRPRQPSLRRPRRPKRTHGQIVSALVGRSERAEKGTGFFRPSLNATKEEREWIMTHLDRFYAGKQITDVLRRVKGGKEANVYCCTAHPDTGLDLIAAKLYRPRKFRSLKNDTQYRQGRPLLDGQGRVVSQRDWRLHKAIQHKTRVGQEAEQTSWLEYEFQTMRQLYEAGVDVPRPLKHGDHTILMEYVGDRTMPAPTLIDIAPAPEEAHLLFERLMHDVQVMLACHLVHGDLSAYNVLYWNGEVKIIDFPQVVDPRHNHDGYALFQRDVKRLCQYFARCGVASDPAKLAKTMWAEYVSARSLPVKGNLGEPAI